MSDGYWVSIEFKIVGGASVTFPLLSIAPRGPSVVFNPPSVLLLGSGVLCQTSKLPFLMFSLPKTALWYDGAFQALPRESGAVGTALDAEADNSWSDYV